MTQYNPIFRSPIAAPTATVGTAELQVTDLTGAPIILIQGQADDVLKKQFSRIPTKPGDVVDVGQGFLARLTPQEFYIFGKSAGAELPAVAELEEQFAKAKVFAHATDYTHGQAALKLAGAAAAETLSKICGLDFYETVFPNMQVKQTSAAKIKTLIARCDQAGRPTYHLHLSRPLAQYFWETLGEAGQEFGISV